MTTDTIMLRPATASDLESMCALHQRADRHDGVPRVLTLEELREELDGDRVSLDTDVRLASVDGQIVGYAHTFYLPSEVSQERCYVFGNVDPEFRRRGVGTALLAWGVERGSEQLRSSGSDLPKYLRVDGYDYQEDRHRLFERMGFAKVRWFEELIRPLTDLPDVPTIDGLTILPWDATRDDEIREAKNAAFEDHWGSTPINDHNWQQMVHGVSARADLSFFAVEDATGRVVAHCVNHRYEGDAGVTGRQDAWIDNLGTLREWRGKGVASALIAASLHAFAGAGFTHACIGVDGENPTGAARLYRALGFDRVQRAITHEIRVDA